MTFRSFCHSDLSVNIIPSFCYSPKLRRNCGIVRGWVSVVWYHKQDHFELSHTVEEHAEVWTAEDRMRFACLEHMEYQGSSQILTHVWFICRLDHACWNDLLGWILLLLEISLPSSEGALLKTEDRNYSLGGVQTAFSSQSPKQLQQLGNKTLLSLSLN